jgi:hypothetical protein
MFDRIISEIKSQPGLSFVGILTVTVKTVFRQDRSDLPVKVDAIISVDAGESSNAIDKYETTSHGIQKAWLVDRTHMDSSQVGGWVRQDAVTRRCRKSGSNGWDVEFWLWQPSSPYYSPKGGQYNNPTLRKWYYGSGMGV